MQNKLNKRNKGFTIVELIIVMAIIAILILMAIPAYSKYYIRAQKTYADANVRTLYKATIAAVAADYTSQTHATLEPDTAIYNKTDVTPPVTPNPLLADINKYCTGKFKRPFDTSSSFNDAYAICLYSYEDGDYPPTMTLSNYVQPFSYVIFVKCNNKIIDPTADIYIRSQKDTIYSDDPMKADWNPPARWYKNNTFLEQKK